MSFLLAIDIGGVLADPGAGRNERHHGDPLPGSREFLEALDALGVKVVIESSRSDTAAAEWLEAHGLADLYKRLNTDAGDKADAFLDDRMVRFNGEFGGLADRLLDFQPWWDDDYEVRSLAVHLDVLRSDDGQLRPGALDFFNDLAVSKPLRRLLVYTDQYGGTVDQWLRDEGFDRHIDVAAGYKPKCMVYLDGRGVNFDGDYAKALGNVKALMGVEKQYAGQSQPDGGFAPPDNQRVLAVDLHDTITQGPVDHDQYDGGPELIVQPGAIESLRSLQGAGVKVCVWTVWDTERARAWLEAHGVPHDYVNEHPHGPDDTDSPKVWASAYVDDKAVPHNGDWAMTLDYLNNSGLLDKSAKGVWTVRKAVVELSVDDVEHDKSFGGPGRFELPQDHSAGLRVPKGGSCCANCRYGKMEDDGPHCANEHWQEWNGGESRLPVDDPETYCSDWWEPMPVAKEWIPGSCKPGQSAANTGCTPGHDSNNGGDSGDSDHESESKGTYSPDPMETNPKTGLVDKARVGVPAMEVPPPPKEIGRLPHLSKKQAKVEARFADAYLADPDGMADKYLKALRKRKVGEYPNVFATDDVKALNRDVNPSKVRQGEELTSETRKGMAKYNTAVHQTANALAKRAFLKYLDQLPEGKKSVLVTNGGCAAGKGSTLSRSTDPKDPHYGMLPAAEQVGAIWDAAGEQNATENEWIFQECKKRGITPTFAYVWAEPKDSWDASDRGVIRRAMRKGRMVDARLFADSYALGAKNMKAFVDKHPDANFVFIDNRSKSAPKLLDKFPEETLQWDAEKIYADAVAGVKKREKDLDPVLVKGGLNGTRIWGPPKAGGKSAGGFAAGEREPGRGGREVDEARQRADGRGHVARSVGGGRRIILLRSKGAFGTIAAAGRWAAGKWAALEQRYGKWEARSMVAAMLATMPLPGNVAVIMAAAEGLRAAGIIGKAQGYAEWGAGGPHPSKDDLHEVDVFEADLEPEPPMYANGWASGAGDDAVDKSLGIPLHPTFHDGRYFLTNSSGNDVAGPFGTEDDAYNQLWNLEKTVDVEEHSLELIDGQYEYQPGASVIGTTATTEQLPKNFVSGEHEIWNQGEDA